MRVVPSFAAAALLTASIGSTVYAIPYSLLVTQSPPGPVNQNTSNWRGVLQYTVDGFGAPLINVPGVVSSDVRDPAGITYRLASNEVLIGNRHGNNAADGVGGSISRFTFDPNTATLTPSGAITGNGLFGVHQLNFSPTTGELFAANVNAGVSRFLFDGSGNAIPNGTISSGSARGVAVSPDGGRLYVTGASNTIRQFNLSTGAELTSLVVPGSPNLHYLRVHNNELYAAGLDSSLIYRYTIDSAGGLTPKSSFSAVSPITATFSLDGLELFTTGHRDTDLIERFTYDQGTDNWVLASTLNSSFSLGDALVLPVAIPEPAALGLGGIAWLVLGARPRRQTTAG
jgi:WD40 repeat protein